MLLFNWKVVVVYWKFECVCLFVCVCVCVICLLLGFCLERFEVVFCGGVCYVGKFVVVVYLKGVVFECEVIEVWSGVG